MATKVLNYNQICALPDHAQVQLTRSDGTKIEPSRYRWHGRRAGKREFQHRKEGAKTWERDAPPVPGEYWTLARPLRHKPFGLEDLDARQQ